jgi:hypothetical protein
MVLPPANHSSSVPPILYLDRKIMVGTKGTQRVLGM